MPAFPPRTRPAFPPGSPPLSGPPPFRPPGFFWRDHTAYDTLPCVRMVLTQTSGFAADWRRLGLGDEDLRALESAVMQRPERGSVMRGSGGLRKVRFAPPSWHTGK